MNSSVVEAYNDWHSRHQADLDANAPWYQMIKSRLDLVRDFQGRTVLEIGCGLGSFATWIARQNPHPEKMVAADFSPVAVEKARIFAQSQNIHQVTWITADIQSIQFGSEFDTVFSCETIEHVPNPPLAIKELARVLRPGGRLYLTTPNYLSTIGIYRAYCWLRGKTFDEGGQPICQLTMIPRILSWIRKSGLRIIEWNSTGHYVPFPGRPPIEVPLLGKPSWMMRWFGHHSLFIAQKPEA